MKMKDGQPVTPKEGLLIVEDGLVRQAVDYFEVEKMFNEFFLLKDEGAPPMKVNRGDINLLFTDYLDIIDQAERDGGFRYTEEGKVDPKLLQEPRLWGLIEHYKHYQDFRRVLGEGSSNLSLEKFEDDSVWNNGQREKFVKTVVEAQEQAGKDTKPGLLLDLMVSTAIDPSNKFESPAAQKYKEVLRNYLAANRPPAPPAAV